MTGWKIGSAIKEEKEKKQELKNMSIFEKLQKARTEILAKDWSPDGTVTQLGYQYLTEKKMKALVAPVLNAHGLNWNIQYKDIRVLEPTVNPKSGTVNHHVIVKAQVDITDGETTITAQAYGEGIDTGDKAISKAQTNATKNVIANLFLVSSYDEEQQDAQEVKTQYVSNVERAIAKEEAISQAPPTTIIKQTSDVEVIAPAKPTKQQLILVNRIHDKIKDNANTEEIADYDKAQTLSKHAKEYIEKYRPTVA